MYLMSKSKLETHVLQLQDMAQERMRLVHRDEPKFNFKKVSGTKELLGAK